MMWDFQVAAILDFPKLQESKTNTRESCTCEPPATGDEEISWHGENSSPSENSSSVMSCFTGGPAQCLPGAAKVWSFFGALQPGQRDERLGLTILREEIQEITERANRTIQYTRYKMKCDT